MRIAGRYGGEAQEIVLHSGPSKEGGSKPQIDSINSASNIDSNVTPVPGPSNASTISSALRNVAQIIAAGELYTRMYNFDSILVYDQN